MLEEMQRLAGQIEAGYNRPDINWQESNTYMSAYGCCPIGAAFASLYPEKDTYGVDNAIRQDENTSYIGYMAEKAGVGKALAQAVSNAHEYYGVPAKTIIQSLRAGIFDVTAFPQVAKPYQR